jgi:nigerose phosphorylase
VLARFSLEVALKALETVLRQYPADFDRVVAKLALTDDEIAALRGFVARLYVPAPDPTNDLIPQFDGYFTLEDALLDVVRARLAHPDLHPGGPHGPYQSTQSIKQADVILLLYLLRHDYSSAVKQANWHYYEPRTAHDSSLSPMAYALVAADVGMTDWAYRYFLHTAMLDLLGTGPHWNLGVHTAALGGAWQTVVNGFCQIELRNDGVHLHADPVLPAHWQRVSFGFFWHGHYVRFDSDRQRTAFTAETGPVPLVYPGGCTALLPGHEFIFSEDKTQ